jgi:hypothetical protein
MKHILSLIWLPLLLISCATLVSRKPYQTMEPGDRNLPLKYHADVFKDYLWMTPPLYGKQVCFDKGYLEIKFAGGTLKFNKLMEGSISMDERGRLTTSTPIITDGDCYYNLDLLPWKTVMKEKQVPTMVWVTESVPVTKSRVVTERVAVQKSHTVNKSVAVQKSCTVYDSSTKSSHTEYYTANESKPHTEHYTDYETKSHTEIYTTHENRRVSKTEWVWKPVPEKVFDTRLFSCVV